MQCSAGIQFVLTYSVYSDQGYKESAGRRFVLKNPGHQETRSSFLPGKTVGNNNKTEQFLEKSIDDISDDLAPAVYEQQLTQKCLFCGSRGEAKRFEPKARNNKHQLQQKPGHFEAPNCVEDTCVALNTETEGRICVSFTKPGFQSESSAPRCR